MKLYESRGDWMFRWVPRFIGLVFVLIVCVWIAYGVLAYKAVQLASETDLSSGLKPVIERIWCGKPGCTGQ